nr:MAG TPA: Minor capsid protein from bacteriophage [Caudoviricetes sp.]
MGVSKHAALKSWVEPFLADNYLYFESTEAYPNVRVLVPNYGDYTNRTDICGFKYKSYSFVFIGYEQLDEGTSDVNINNMNLMDTFTEWLEQQKADGNFPDFGPNCSEYDIIPLQNMANLASVQDNNLAKYMLGVRIDYKEE